MKCKSNKTMIVEKVGVSEEYALKSSFHRFN